MSRSIDICYQNETSGPETSIEIKDPYHLFGTQQISKEFWSLPIWKEIGVKRLSVLGHSDPVYFSGWEDMDELRHEIELFQNNLPNIDFSLLAKTEWLANLTYCYNLLITSSPKNKIPLLTIG